MKRHAVKLPVLNGNTAGLILGAVVGIIVGLVSFGAFDSTARVLTAVNAMALPWAYSLYSLIRIGDHGGKPLEIGIGRKLPELPPPPPAPRLPAAFPADPGQCYICGLPNPDYKHVFGSDTHKTCEEWLGAWKPPQWNIFGEKTETVRNPDYDHYMRAFRRGYANESPVIAKYIDRQSTQLLGLKDGWETPEEIEAYCARTFINFKLIRAERPGYGSFGPTVIGLTHLNKEEDQ